MGTEEKILIEFTAKQLRNVTFYYVVGTVATGYAAYQVSKWVLTKTFDTITKVVKEQNTINIKVKGEA